MNLKDKLLAEIGWFPSFNFSLKVAVRKCPVESHFEKQQKIREKTPVMKSFFGKLTILQVAPENIFWKGSGMG